MTGEAEITLKIDVFTPETIPMSRLALYLGKFAALLGHHANVHFSDVTSGSTTLRAFSDQPTIPKIKARAQKINDGSASRGAKRAYAELDDLLAEDNAVGEIALSGSKVIEFPGRRRIPSEEIGPVRRPASIDGEVFWIGGKDETINVHLMDREKEFRCVVSVELAKKLARHLRGGKVRLSGEGLWYRTDGLWSMRKFEAESFTVPDERPLRATIDQIRESFSGVRPDEFMATMIDLRRG
jgi:hypothetical protein